MFRIFPLCIFPFFVSLHSTGQNPHPVWRNYTTDYGLPSPEVYIAMQDSKGYMWFGTDNGVSRFDGYTFRNYGPKDGLHNNVVFDLQEDQIGRIWMMTHSGNVYYHLQDSIYPYVYNDTIQLFREQFRYGHQLYYDEEDGCMYISLSHLGILQMDPDGHYRIWNGKNPISAVVKEFKNEVLYAYYHAKDNYIDYQKWKIRNNVLGPIEFYNATLLNICFGKAFGESALQQATLKKLNNGFYLFDVSKTMGLIKDYKIQWVQKTKTGITNFFEDAKGDLFICYSNRIGIEQYEDTLALRKGINANYLRGYSTVNLNQDRNNGYWFSTLENGIFYTPNFDLLIYDASTGLSNSYVSAIEEKDDSTLFIGLRNENIYTLNKKNRTLKKLPDRISLSGLPQTDIYFNGEHEVLFGGGHLNFITNQAWGLIKYKDDLKPDGDTWNTQSYTASKHPNQIWVNHYNRAAILDIITKKLIPLEFLRDSKITIFSSYEDNKGRLWLGRTDGLWKLQGDTTLIRPDTMHPIFYNRIKAIQQLPDNTFVFGTKGNGILLWKGHHFSEIRESDGLTSDMIENIYVDKNGVIWVGTLSGLNKITIAENGSFTIRNFTMYHGLPTNEINEVKVVDDEVWVATTRGLVCFPYEQKINQESKAPLITSFLADRRPVDLSGKPSLGFKENNVTINFLTFNYRMNGQIPYRFRMDKGDWTFTRNTSVNFPSLPHGNRLFEVQSQNEDGIWSESITLAFYIAPPWWKTWWAISLACIVAIGGGIVIYNYRTRQLKKEIKLQKQLAETERHALRSQMNPHFIFNSLNAIQGYIATGDKTAANRYLSRFAKLIRSALQHSRLTKVPLEDDLRSLENYIELERMRFEKRFDYEIKVAENVPAADLTIPPMLVQPFVENAIVHGLASKEGKGRIEIDYRFENGSLQISVTDNGIGIEESKKRKDGVNSSHKSIGLTVTKRRLDMLAGNGEMGRVDIEDLKNEHGEVLGTRARISIPLEIE